MHQRREDAGGHDALQRRQRLLLLDLAMASRKFENRRGDPTYTARVILNLTHNVEIRQELTPV